MKALILAAGYATRLYPLTKDQPKPLLLIAGKPIIEYSLDKLNDIEEIDEIYIVTNDTFKSKFDEWLLKYSSSKKIKILNDGTTSNENRLGAIGDIAFAIKEENILDDLFIIAGDNLFDNSLKPIIELSKQKDSSILCAHDLKDPKLLANKFGTIIVDDNKIIDFEEKPEEPKSSLCSTAIYFLKKEDIVEISNCIKENPKLDNLGDFIKYLIHRKSVYTYLVDKWYDIGNIEQLEEADKIFTK